MLILYFKLIFKTINKEGKLVKKIGDEETPYTFDELAKMTEGCTCSDINVMFNTALRRTVFSNRKRVTLEDFKKALEEIRFEEQQKIHVVKGFGVI